MLRQAAFLIASWMCMPLFKKAGVYLFVVSKVYLGQMYRYTGVYSTAGTIFGVLFLPLIVLIGLSTEAFDTAMTSRPRK